MNIHEAAELIKRIKAYSPSFAAAEGTVVVWADLLADISAEAAKIAVRDHFTTGGPWIGVADIRRRVAAAAGVLPPDPDTAMAEARAWIRWRGDARFPAPRTGEPALHPATRAAVKVIGWDAVAETRGADLRFRWRETYGARAAEFETRALSPGGINTAGREIAAARPRELPPADVDLEPPAEPDPGQVEALKRGTRRLTKTPPPPPRADYAPPTEAEMSRQAEEFRRWAAAEGLSLDTIEIGGDA